MTPRTILLYFDNASNVAPLVRMAASVAKRSGSDAEPLLIGAHATPWTPIYGGVGEVVSSEMIKRDADIQRAVSERIQSRFLDAATECELAAQWESLSTDTHGESAALRERARGADLVILPQPSDDDTSRFIELAVRGVVMGSGRPVLVVPKVGEFSDVGRHLFIGWSPTREATRAVHDALPLTYADSRATLLWVSKGRGEHPELERSAQIMSESLERQGIACTVTHWADAEIPIGDVLLNESFECGADLIVCGAFGHSRLYDLVVGATTNHLLKHMTLPVLFAH